MNEVDRQVAELQAQSGEKKKAEYSVEVESEDIAAPTEENEIEIPQESKTFQAEVDDTQEEPVVEDKSKQEEVKAEEEPKGDSKQNYVNLEDVKKKQLKLLRPLNLKEIKFKKN